MLCWFVEHSTTVRGCSDVTKALDIFVDCLFVIDIVVSSDTGLSHALVSFSSFCCNVHRKEGASISF